MQKLRLLIVLSSIAYAIYYYMFPSEPLWLDVGSELALVVINGFMLIYLVWSNSRIKFDQQEQLLYDNEFSGLSRIEYSRLLKISEWELERPGYVYARIGSALEDIFYIVSGRAEARLADGNNATIKEGSVIGEVSYRLKCPASATVTAMDSCMCLRWNQDELRALCKKNGNIKRTLDALFSSDMAKKLSDTPD
jgi:CRP-like cAMP-binding protein